MAIPALPDPAPFTDNPPLGFRFRVLFLSQGVIPNQSDIFFQKVSGLGSTVETYTVEEGGQNLYTGLRPKKVTHENLVLERGLAIRSPLGVEFNAAMSLFVFMPSNILIMLLDSTSQPIASWLCMNAYPVKWSVSDLDANNNGIVVEHMELAYERLQVIRL